MKLFKSKSKQIKEACKDIHVIVDDSIKLINNMQENVKSMQEGVQVLRELNKEMQIEKQNEIKQYAEILEHLKKLAGELN